MCYKCGEQKSLYGKTWRNNWLYHWYRHASPTNFEIYRPRRTLKLVTYVINVCTLYLKSIHEPWRLIPTITMQDAEYKWINATNLKTRMPNRVRKMIHIYYFHLGLKKTWLLAKRHCLTTLCHVHWNAARPNYDTAFTGFKGGQFWIHYLACSIFWDENTAIFYLSFHRRYIILGTNAQGRWTSYAHYTVIRRK